MADPFDLQVAPAQIPLESEDVGLDPGLDQPFPVEGGNVAEVEHAAEDRPVRWSGAQDVPLQIHLGQRLCHAVQHAGGA